MKESIKGLKKLIKKTIKSVDFLVIERDRKNENYVNVFSRLWAAKIFNRDFEKLKAELLLTVEKITNPKVIDGGVFSEKEILIPDFVRNFFDDKPQENAVRTMFIGEYGVDFEGRVYLCSDENIWLGRIFDDCMYFADVYTYVRNENVILAKYADGSIIAAQARLITINKSEGTFVDEH